MSSAFLRNLCSNHPMLSVCLRDFYIIKYSDDVDMFNLFKNPDSTFEDLLNAIISGVDVYSLIPDDSIVRERLMGEISEFLNFDYDVVYNAWIENDKTVHDAWLNELNHQVA